jgi:hypothetical protein
MSDDFDFVKVREIIGCATGLWPNVAVFGFCVVQKFNPELAAALERAHGQLSENRMIEMRRLDDGSYKATVLDGEFGTVESCSTTQRSKSGASM